MTKALHPAALPDAKGVCEHGDHPAPRGARFCSEACASCERDSEIEGCDGICLTLLPARPARDYAAAGRRRARAMKAIPKATYRDRRKDSPERVDFPPTFAKRSARIAEEIAAHRRANKQDALAIAGLKRARKHTGGSAPITRSIFLAEERIKTREARMRQIGVQESRPISIPFAWAEVTPAMWPPSIISSLPVEDLKRGLKRLADEARDLRITRPTNTGEERFLLQKIEKIEKEIAQELRARRQHPNVLALQADALATATAQQRKDHQILRGLRLRLPGARDPGDIIRRILAVESRYLWRSITIQKLEKEFRR